MFRVVLPACEEPAYVLDPETSLPAFDPSYGTSGRYTFGRIPARGADWRINNAGWISAFDYDPRAEGDSTLRVAVLGDSFVENFYTDLDHHVDALLDGMLGPGSDAWGFGRSGAYLYQYVIMAREIDSLYDPDVFVIFLNNNDVRSSLADFGTPTRYYFQIASSDTGYVEIPPAPFSRSGFRKLLRRSALLRYLTINTKLGWFAEVQLERGTDGLAGTLAEARADTATVRILRDAADWMLGRLREEHPGKSFVFVGDVLRPPLYAGETGSLEYVDCGLVRVLCDSLPGMRYLDLEPVYREAWARDGLLFEYGNNWHWNAYGNRIICEALAGFLEDEGLLGRRETARVPGPGNRREPGL